MSWLPESGTGKQHVSACGCGAPVAASIWSWARIAFSAVLAVNAMAVTLSVNTSLDAQSDIHAVRLGLFAVTALVAVLVGDRLVRGLWLSLREKRVSVELLFVLTLGGALGVSLQSMWFRDGPVYFEVVALLMVVYAFGAELNHASRDRALQNVAELSITHRLARVRNRDGTVSMVVAAEVNPSDRVEVLPGEMTPVDGILLEPPVLVEEGSLRGEYAPQLRKPGEIVVAGSVVVDSMAVLQALEPGHVKSLDAVLCEVNQGLELRSEVEQAADRLARWFVPGVASVAVVTLIIWAYLGPIDDALFHAMAVFLVACPCALGFATPLALWTAMARLRHVGIHVAGSSDVEALATVDYVVLDKTGTLSSTEAVIEDIHLEDSIAVSVSRVHALLEATERDVAHPYARAFSRYLARPRSQQCEEGLTWLREALHVVPGCGIRAKLRSKEGHRHELELLRSEKDAGLEIRIDNARVGIAWVSEDLHPRRFEALALLEALSVDAILLTGDQFRRAANAGVSQFMAGMSPGEKREVVVRLQSEGRRVLFVGDGINDAPAMSVSDAAIAVGIGAPLAKAVAGNTWMGGDPRSIPAALRIARETMHRVQSNFRWALGYNTTGMALAVVGMLHPVTAALLMVVSSVVITWRAMALLDQKDEDLPLSKERNGSLGTASQDTPSSAAVSS